MRCAGMSSFHITVWHREVSLQSQSWAQDQWVQVAVTTRHSLCLEFPYILSTKASDHKRSCGKQGGSCTDAAMLSSELPVRKLSGAGNATEERWLPLLNLLRTNTWGTFQWKGTFSWGPNLKSWLEWKKNWAKRAGVQFRPQMSLYLFASKILFQPCN